MQGALAPMQTQRSFTLIQQLGVDAPDPPRELTLDWPRPAARDTMIAMWLFVGATLLSSVGFSLRRYRVRKRRDMSKFHVSRSTDSVTVDNDTRAQFSFTATSPLQSNADYQTMLLSPAEANLQFWSKSPAASTRAPSPKHLENDNLWCG